MLELILLGIAGAAGIWGHLKLRSFVRRRLRYTSWVEKRWPSVVAGAVTAVVVAGLPLLSLGAGLLVGTGVGTGIAMGVSDVRNRRLIDE